MDCVNTPCGPHDLPLLTVSGLRIELPTNADRDFAVNDISFDVKAGETVCLLGESGSGKSVIAQAIMGLLPPALALTHGRILLEGEDLTAATGGRIRALRGSRMAMVFQEPMTALNPVMRCGDQVNEMLVQHSGLGSVERRERVLAIFRRVHLPEPERVYRAYPHELSGGQRQRIVIAIALILKPSLLICDEPTTALDVTTQAEILGLIKELQEENGTGVLFITHDFGVVADIADQVVVMRLGESVELGCCSAVLGSPREGYTRSLLQAVPQLKPKRTPGTAGQTVLLEAKGLAKRYQRRAGFFARRIEIDAARDVSLRLCAGETVGIVGESGSGKSTVARCIARLIEPSAGTVGLVTGDPHGSSRAERSAFRRRVQVVFQDPSRSLNPRRTVGQSIVEGPINFGVDPETAWLRAEELMGLVHLRPDVLHRFPSEFSGGQRQRLCIARALACEPAVLIADEAVSALDVSVQDQILKLLEEVQSRLQIGILFITHDLRVASQVCDRIIVMHKGRVVEEGNASDVLGRPEHDYTRKLLAAVPGQAWDFGRMSPSRDGGLVEGEIEPTGCIP